MAEFGDGRAVRRACRPVMCEPVCVSVWLAWGTPHGGGRSVGGWGWTERWGVCGRGWREGLAVHSGQLSRALQARANSTRSGLGREGIH